MQAVDAADSRRQGEGYVRVRVLAGTMAGTTRLIPSVLHRIRLLQLGTRIPLYYDELAAAIFDGGDGHLPGDDHRRSNKRVRAAAASEAILQEVTASDALQSECAICLQDFHADETLRAMPCSHAFHQNCITQWLCRKATCPLCRCQLPEEEQEEEEDGRIAN
ncbi:unnamed protein product [Urochloa humidicola]